MALPYEVTPAIYELDMRNKAAEAVISSFALEHSVVDIASGLVGGLVPGGSIAALVAQLAYQATRVYPAMIRKLAVIYGAEPDDFTARVVRGAAFARHHFRSVKRPRDEIRSMLIDDLGVPADIVDEVYDEF
jgi:hypothetical protein